MDDGRSQLHVGFLGRLTLTNGCDNPIVVRSRRARGLFAYLGLQQGQPAVRQTLCGLFWADRAEPQARASLRQALCDLRAALPDDIRTRVEIDRDAVRLDLKGVGSDVSAVREAIDQRRPDALAALVHRMGAARLLEDLEISGPFCDWLDLARARFDRDLAQGVHQQLSLSETAQDWAAVRRLGEAYLTRDPLDEATAVALIRAESACGEQVAARRRLAGLQDALGRAFGIKPGAEAYAALAVRAPTDGATARPADARPDPAADSGYALPAVFVAAFDTTAPDGRSASLADILQSEIISALTGFRELRVISTPFRLRQLDGPGWRNLGADYVLGGSLWGSDPEAVRLNGQVIRAHDQQVIWSERMDVRHSDIVSAVDHIVGKMIGAASPSIDADLEIGVPAALNDRYARYVAARRAADAPASFEAARQAADTLEGLIAEAPDFILPYLPLARLYNNDFAYTRPLSSGEPERARAFSLARAALARDRSHVHAHTLAAWCHLRQGNHGAAQMHFDRGLSLNPFHADRLMEVGYGYLFLGRLDEAAELLSRCLSLNPMPKDGYYIDLALLEIIRGDCAKAAAHLDLVAKPMTWSLLYEAVCALRDGGVDRRASAAFLGRAESLWDPARPFTPSAVLQWVDADHPFASAALRAQFLDWVRRALF